MEIKLEGNVLTITCPLSNGVPSQSGKTLIVATTNGFTVVPNSTLRLSLNVIKPRS